jgi:hypothetical protein
MKPALSSCFDESIAEATMVLHAQPEPALPPLPELHQRLLVQTFLLAPPDALSLALSCRYFYLHAGPERHALRLQIDRLAAKRSDHDCVLHLRIFKTSMLETDAPLSAYLLSSCRAGFRDGGGMHGVDAGRMLDGLHRLPVPERLQALSTLIERNLGIRAGFVPLFDSMLGMLCGMLAEKATHRDAALATLRRLSAMLSNMAAGPEQHACLGAMLQAACAASNELQVPMLTAISAGLDASAQFVSVCLACLHGALPRLDAAQQLALRWTSSPPWLAWCIGGCSPFRRRSEDSMDWWSIAETSTAMPFPDCCHASMRIWPRWKLKPACNCSG